MKVIITFPLLISRFTGFTTLLASVIQGSSETQNSSVTNHTSASANSTSTSSRRDHQFGVLHTLDSLIKWAVKEEQMVSALTERLELMEKETKLIKTFLEDYNQSSGEALKQLHSNVTNTTEEDRGRVVASSYVLSHKMTSRYNSVTKTLRELLNSTEYKKNQENVELIFDMAFDVDTPSLLDHISVRKHTEGNSTVANNNRSKGKEKVLWPNWADMYMSLHSFVTIQEVYGDKAASLSMGLEIDTKAGGTLSALQCTEIGIYALNRRKYFIAIDWLERAIELAQTEEDEGNPSILADVLFLLLTTASQGHNRIFQNGIWKEDSEDFLVFTKPVKEESAAEREERRSMLQTWYSETVGNLEDNYAQFQHYDACLGSNRQTPEMAKDLNCYYEKTRHPYLYINPVKAEVLSENPPVIQFYEVIGNKLIEEIKDRTRSKMALSLLVGVDDLDYESITQYRTSVSIGIWAWRIPNFLQISEILSGLQIKNASEPTQIVEYVYGRHYTYHRDQFEGEEESAATVKEHGDRVATMLYYLEVPTLGGLTSFGRAGRSAYPERGSAVFWLNMYRNGTTRNDSDHGACPVLHSHKVVANNWIRYKGNWRNYQCTLNQLE